MTNEEREQLVLETTKGDVDAALELIRVAIQEKSYHQVQQAVVEGVKDLSVRLEAFKSMARQISNAVDHMNTAEALDVGEKFIVRLYDGMDYAWSDVSGPLSYEDAQAKWNELTKDGTKNTCYDDIDYYKVFPQNIRMLHAR